MLPESTSRRGRPGIKSSFAVTLDTEKLSEAVLSIPFLRLLRILKGLVKVSQLYFFYVNFTADLCITRLSHKSLCTYNLMLGIDRLIGEIAIHFVELS